MFSEHTWEQKTVPTELHQGLFCSHSISLNMSGNFSTIWECGKGGSVPKHVLLKKIIILRIIGLLAPPPLIGLFRPPPPFWQNRQIGQNVGKNFCGMRGIRSIDM